MVKHVKKILGKKFGMLTVISDVNPPAHLKRPKNRYALCQCDCGRKTSVRVDHIRRGKTQSCGCKASDAAFRRALEAIESGDSVVFAEAGAMEQTLRAGADCAAAEHSRLRDEEAARIAAIPRQSEKERRFGLEAGAYDEMLATQSGVCAICEQPEVAKALSIDHCHTTGKVRGLLCNRCNQGLGFFGDDIMRLAKAIKYLSDSLQ